MPNFLNTAASWIANIKTQNIPTTVYEKAEDQLNHVKFIVCETALHLGHITDKNECEHPDFYSYQNIRMRAIERMRHDWDDYLFMSHAGHSSVLVALAESHRKGHVSKKELLTAIIAGNELAGRVASAALFGHQNGQAWTFSHQISTIATIASLNNWEVQKTMRVLGISFSQPHFALFPGFFSYAKSSAAWIPINSALEAIRLEPLMPAGLPQDLIAGKGGMLQYFTHLPIPFFLEGLDKSWVTLALTNKKYPGCAYFQNGIARTLNFVENTPILVEEIASIDVETNILTIGVQETMRRYIPKTNTLTPEEATFSLSLPIAIILLQKQYGLTQLDESFLIENSSAIRALDEKINLNHKWKYTGDVLRRINKAVNIKALMKSIGLKDAMKIRDTLNEYGSDNHLMRSAILDLEFYKLIRDLMKNDCPESYSFADADFTNFSWDFESVITINMKNGQKYVI